MIARVYRAHHFLAPKCGATRAQRCRQRVEFLGQDPNVENDLQAYETPLVPAGSLGGSGDSSGASRVRAWPHPFYLRPRICRAGGSMSNSSSPFFFFSFCVFGFECSQSVLSRCRGPLLFTPRAKHGERFVVHLTMLLTLVSRAFEWSEPADWIACRFYLLRKLIDPSLVQQITVPRMMPRRMIKTST